MMRNRITNFWNVAAPLLLGSIALASLPLGFLWLRVSFASAFRLFDCGPLHCSSAACHHFCCRLGVLFCSGNRQFPDLQVATYRGGDRAAVGEQLRFKLPAYRRVGRDIIRRPSAVSSP
jgi:hypothetical protein